MSKPSRLYFSIVSQRHLHKPSHLPQNCHLPFHNPVILRVLSRRSHLVAQVLHNPAQQRFSSLDFLEKTSSLFSALPKGFLAYPTRIRNLRCRAASSGSSVHCCLVRSSCRTSRTPSHEVSDGILSVWQNNRAWRESGRLHFPPPARECISPGSPGFRTFLFQARSIRNRPRSLPPAAGSCISYDFFIASFVTLFRKLISHFGCLGRLLRTHHSLVAPWSSPPSSAGTSDMLGFVPYSAGAKRNLSGVMASSSPPMLT